MHMVLTVVRSGDRRFSKTDGFLAGGDPTGAACARRERVGRLGPTGARVQSAYPIVGGQALTLGVVVVVLGVAIVNHRGAEAATGNRDETAQLRSAALSERTSRAVSDRRPL
jgi:hypothetical protein